MGAICPVQSTRMSKCDDLIVTVVSRVLLITQAITSNGYLVLSLQLPFDLRQSWLNIDISLRACPEVSSFGQWSLRISWNRVVFWSCISSWAIESSVSTAAVPLACRTSTLEAVMRDSAPFVLRDAVALGLRACRFFLWSWFSSFMLFRVLAIVDYNSELYNSHNRRPWQ